MINNNDVILELSDVKVHFKLDEGLLKAVDGVSFAIRKGKTLGIVGESGCGKSVTSNAIFKILPSYATLEGEVLLYEKDGKKLDPPIDIAKLNPTGSEIRSIRGGNIAMIFQEPMKAFSPIHTIGNQIIEGIQLHVQPDEKKAREIAIEMLRKVGIANPEQRVDEYPHQLSGGMRQRAMIAMALSCEPSILIADEPTTALDVTVQAQVLDLINNLKDENGASVIFITHDLGVIAEMSERVMVMYAGKVAEVADVRTIFRAPKHPYTIGLINSKPDMSMTADRLTVIPGNVPDLNNKPSGCPFHPRCERAMPECSQEYPPDRVMAPGHEVACWLYAKGGA